MCDDELVASLHAENARLDRTLRDLPQQIKDRCEREASLYDSFMEKDYKSGISVGGSFARSVVLAEIRRLDERKRGTE